MSGPAEALPWQQAWERALYGPEGFYRRHAPAEHFRTAAHAAPGPLAAALVRLARSCGCTAVVEVGAGRGELLTALHEQAPDLALHAVEVAARPTGLPEAIGWTSGPPDRQDRTLLLGWELLDVVPCPVLEADGSGVLREVLVDTDGRQRPGPPLSREDQLWARRWWPGPYAPGDRVEVGAPRERLWSDLVERLRPAGGLALAVDYDHALGTRPRHGTLRGFRAGRATAPVPDGRHDLTAHVALDAVADLLPGSWLVRQREALAALGTCAGRPDPALARTDPAAYLTALAELSASSELTDADGLGGFGWLLTALDEVSRTAVEALLGRNGHRA